MTRLLTDPRVLAQLRAWAELYDDEADGLTTAADFVEYVVREAARHHVDISRQSKHHLVHWQPLDSDDEDQLEDMTT